MEGLQIDMIKIKISNLNSILSKNKILTFLSFILLMTAIFLIKIHPNSVWYYFTIGFLSCRMLELILQKSEIKNTINNAYDRLIKMQKGIL